MSPAQSGQERHALKLDAGDPLPTRRAEFRIPPHGGGEAAYFAGNSLGLQPKALRARLGEELDDWASLAVEGHLEGRRPWFSYHELLRGPAARLVGALPREVVVMNSLTVNLHLLMVSFYRPAPERHAILIEDAAFPSDSYAVRSQAAFHGYDPDEAVIRLAPRVGEAALRSEDVVSYLAEHGHKVALVLLGAVNYYSGELLDIAAITAAGHAAGAAVGWDLAHAAGNVELRLHDAGADWAAWCSYKYLNAGPGSLAGAFVHERHLADRALPKLAGWWSTDPATRFQMAPVARPVDSADAWQLSNPPILSMSAVLLSLEMFDQTGMPALRAKSLRLTAYLEALLDEVCVGRPAQIVTPREPRRRGAQLSVRVHGRDVGPLTERLRQEHGVFADARRPDVIRLAPAPLYSTFHDCWRAATALAAVLDGGRPG
ncbi:MULTISPECIES: kynureninase [unclassified Pseudofrankia]|uniref:kynureninase n=1 Tax=unclassified Pseudofrankia TaxID=2994372 RepID=UPI0008D9CB6C|nr:MULTISPECIES: kynureninase [unclassified Pseudofrankia]MDT3440078.1 kynureninase [Pseudofrankia sp. BMG5.37]OHV44699.1 kynureninase [Pseudofrankia sp. BMG5.36]